ncbi:hypothetical protein [Salinimicrobium oceani]|uniref:AraC-type arabinose-binding/dimerisation domain-containing protein n=1 Tax=Salinimicrobium oceani TaxID=2722702 RepID=A0ABX1CZL8_9FLAO|nr:hypothetical protein [Salinimicrobium oceani]NJW52333.1 hypothetical protein [Salinimicrobium oceani]
MLLKELNRELSSASKPLVKRFEQAEGSHVLAIGLNHDVILKEHKSDIPARIVVIKGAITYISGNNSIHLDVFDELEIPIGEYHSIEPREASIFFVIKK